VNQNKLPAQNSELKIKTPVSCCFLCKKWAQQFGLFFLVLLVYGHTLSFTFVYDDLPTILNNPAITSLKNIRDFFFDKNSVAIPTSPLVHEIYRPLKTLSVSFDHALYGFNPIGYHTTNLLLHTCVGILLFQLLELLGFASGLRFFWSAIFLIHPALFENVAYVSARADILSALFLLLVFKEHLFLRNATPLKSQIKSMLFFFLACLAKETAVMYPLFLLGFLRIQKVSLQKSVPYWILAAAYLYLRQSVIVDFAQRDPYLGSLWLIQATMMKTWFLYLTGFVWPLHLDILPGILLELYWMNLRTMSALIFLLLTAFLLFWQRKNLGLSGVGLWWFFVFLLPVANLIPIKAFMAWRFVYISWIGLVLAACFLFSKLPERRFLKIILLCWSLALSLLTVKASASFRDSESLYKSMQATLAKRLQITPKNDYLLSDYAKTWIARRNYSKALEYLKKVTPQTRKELGESFLFDWVFTCYQLEHFQEILQTLSWIPPKKLSAKSLLIQAHGSVLAGANADAKRLYKELFLRDLDVKTLKDCIVIYRFLEHAEKLKEQKKAGKEKKWKESLTKDPLQSQPD